MNRSVVIFAVIFFPFLLKAQVFYTSNEFSVFKPSVTHTFSTSLNIEKDSLSLTHKKHSPNLASIYSAVLPGLGQAYNKKYWKIPLIYAGLGSAGYFGLDERKAMLKLQKALILLSDKDSTTNPDSFYIKQPIAQLKAERNLHRTNRDYLLIGFVGIYLINIVDAAIDAHFYNFNIDKPLAMQKTRHWYFASSRVQNIPALGFAYRF